MPGQETGSHIISGIKIRLQFKGEEYFLRICHQINDFVYVSLCPNEAREIEIDSLLILHY